MSEYYFTEINKITNVSRETFSRIEKFVNLLLKWNKKINLIGRADEKNIWERHIFDSVQISKYIPADTKVITDFGSGGGLPAMLLSIMSSWEINFVESDQRKCAFLREASALSAGKTMVHNVRIEEVEPWHTDVITARALASLDKLLNFSEKFLQKETKCVFLKGLNVADEIQIATTSWEFTHKINPSDTDGSGNIIEIYSATRKN